MLSVGIPREIKPGEKRVGLTPSGVRRLKEAGVRVWVEKNAGAGSGYSNQDYENAGAEIAGTASKLYQQSGLIQKVKEPLRPEWNFLKPGLILCSYLHLASPENRELVHALLKQRVTALGFETVSKDGRTLFLEPMSEIAGTLAAYYAGFFGRYVKREKGRILYPPRFMEKLQALASNYPEAPENLDPGKAFIFGGGVAGQKATETLLKMRGEVDLVEKRKDRQQDLRKKFESYGFRFRVWDSQDDFEERLKEADIWLGCVHIPGARAPLVLSLGDLKRFSSHQPKLILDVAVDQGGNFPETHSTTYEDPLYLDSCSNLRFGITNVPSLCGRGASEAIERMTLPYLFRLAQDWQKALREFPELQSGLQVFDGKLVHEAVAHAHHLTWEPFKG